MLYSYLLEIGSSLYCHSYTKIMMNVTVLNHVVCRFDALLWLIGHLSSVATNLTKLIRQ